MLRRGLYSRIMFSAAEPSADVYAADLAHHLHRLDPSLGLLGVGGRRMAAAGVDVRLDITDTSTFGLWDLGVSLPGHLRAGLDVRRLLARERPDLLVLIDAPALNVPLARIARRMGVPVVYYGPPQTWLWNPDGAVRRIRHAADLIVALFEQEADLYRRAGLTVVYFGHPLADLAAESRRPPTEARRALGVDPEAPVVGLFPGSRPGEVRRLLPSFVDAFARARGRVAGPLQGLVAVASPRRRREIEAILGTGSPLRLVEQPRAVLQASDVILAASGTVLLEAAALDAVAVMAYRLDPLTHLYAKYALGVRRDDVFAVPNIVAGERIVTELVEQSATPARMAEALEAHLTDAGVRRRVREGYARVRDRLGAPGVAARVAERILRMVNPS